MDETEYKTQTYYALKAFLCFFPTLSVAIIIIACIGRYFIAAPALTAIASVVVCLVPFLFQKRILLFFTRKAVLNFNNQGFSIKEYSLQNDALVNDYWFSWDNIKSYKIYFSESNKTFLTIYFKNNNYKTFSFKDEKNEDEAIKEISIFSVFFSFIKQYNYNKEACNKIFFKPGFLTTKVGSLILYTIIVFIIVAIVLHIKMQSRNSIAILMMSIFFLLGLIGKRASDSRFYKKVSQMENAPESVN